MLLVIFGAGASYDSVPHCLPSSHLHMNDRLPLANDLFGDRYEFVRAMETFPDCKALIPFLRGPEVVVERELARIRDQAETFPDAHRELAAIRYYLHLAMWQCQDRWYGHHRGITNYATLLREIKRWRWESKEEPKEKVCFVTFNYETMLEQAMQQVLHLKFGGLDSYIGKDYVLVKPHGSVDWGREVDDFARPEQLNQQNPH